jgi:hypothetical protein
VGRGSTLVSGDIDVKKTVAIALLMVAVLLVSAGSSFAWVHGGGGSHGGFHGHGVVVVGPGCCWGGPWWGWGWGGYYGGYYGPPYYQQPQVVVQPAPIYVERNEQEAQPPESFWYYCPNSRAYYPSVPSCSEAWVKVPPRSE